MAVYGENDAKWEALGALGDSYDWDMALSEARVHSAEPGAPGLSERFTVDDIAEIEAQHVSYYGENATKVNGDYGSELTLVALLRLKDGRYGALDAGNDYTGWGCQDHSFLSVGNREEVLKYGLDNWSRKELGLEPVDAG